MQYLIGKLQFVSNILSIIVHTPKETNEEIKIKRNTFSLAADVDVEESVFFNAELKLFY